MELWKDAWRFRGHQTVQVVFCAPYGAAVEEMGSRIDELEKSISDLIQQATIEEDSKPES